MRHLDTNCSCPPPYFAANSSRRKREFHTRWHCLTVIQPPAWAVISSSARLRICHGSNFSTVCLTRLAWLIATAKSSVYYASLAAKNRPSSASSHQYCRSPGQSWRRCSRIFTALFRDLERVHVVSKKSEHTSLPGFCLSLRAATTVVVSHEGFYAAVEPYSAFGGSTSRMNNTLCQPFSRSTKFNRVPVWPRSMANFSVVESFDPLDVANVDE